MTLAKRFLATVLSLALLATCLLAFPSASAEVSKGTIGTVTAEDLVFYSDFSGGKESSIDEVSKQALNILPDSTLVEGRNGGSAIQVNTVSGNRNNAGIRWNASDADPFAQCSAGLTINTWVYMREMGDWTTLFSYGVGDHCVVIVPRSGSAPQRFRLCINKNGEQELKATDVAACDTQYLDQWVQLTVSQDSATGLAKLYINGQKVGEGVVGNKVYDICMDNNGAGTYNFGITDLYGDATFNGAFDEIAIYKRQLTDVEVNDLYTGVSSTPEDQAAVDYVTSLINAIGTVDASEACKDRIEAARAAYANLSEHDQGFITSYSVLTQAEANYQAAVIAVYEAETGNKLSIHLADGNAADLYHRVALTPNSSASKVSYQTAVDRDGNEASLAYWDGSSHDWHWRDYYYNSGNYNVFKSTGGNHTITMWVNPDVDSFSDYTVLFNQISGWNVMPDGNNVWNTNGIKLMVMSGGYLRLNVYAYGLDGPVLDTDSQVPLQTHAWTMITVTQKTDGDVTTTEIYLNDTLAGTSTSVLSFSVASAYTEIMQLGASAADPNPPFHGYISDWNYYSKNFTMEDVYTAIHGAPQFDEAAIAEVEQKIAAIGTIDSSAEALQRIQAAQAAFDTLSALDQTRVSNRNVLAGAMGKYYNAVANANDGKLLDMDFTSWNDTQNRITATAGSAVSAAAGTKTGDAAVSFAPGETRNDNAYVQFPAADYNPLAYAADGLTISFVANLQEMANFTTLFSVGNGSNFLVMVPQGDGVGFRAAVKINGAETSLAAPLDSQKLNEWAVYTLTQDAQGHTVLYMNDTQVAESDGVGSIYTAVANAGTNMQYSLGLTSLFNDATLRGAVSQWSIYNYAMTADQVTAMANAALSEEVLTVSIVSGNAVASGDMFDLTWNVNLTNQFDDAFRTFNEKYTVVDHGVIVTATEEAMERYGRLLAESEKLDNQVAGQAYKTSFGTTAFNHYSYRRTNVAAGRQRYAMFYVTYAEEGGATFTVLSSAASLQAQ